MSEQQRDRDVRDTEAVREKCPVLLYCYFQLKSPALFFSFFGVVTEKQEACHKSLTPRMVGRDTLR